MPRISKRKKSENNKIKNSSDKKKYKVGIYARLSSNQNDKKNESIQNQVELAKGYILDSLDSMELFDEYCDLGKTGTNFERDEFTRMLQDIRLGDVNCVIVKDLSRFGRNYLEAGNYIEKIFPFLGVRFISIADKFDTGDHNNDDKKMAMNIKNLVNDMYAKDFSKKAKVHLKQRRERGSYIGGLTPYGYKAEWRGKDKKLVVDPNTAPIIRKIFTDFLETNSYQGVVYKLEEELVNPPLIYWKTSEVYCATNSEYKGWLGSSIKRILTSKAYIGSLEQGKSSICSRLESNRERFEKDQWITHNESHEGIISLEKFEQVQNIIEKSEKISREKRELIDKIPIKERLFDEVLVCGNCGRKMTRKRERIQKTNGEISITERYQCQYAYSHTGVDKCVSNRINESKLVELLMVTLKNEFQVYLDKPKKFLSYNDHLGKEVKKKKSAEINDIDKKLQRLDKNHSIHYMEYREGKISQAQYIIKKEDRDNQEKILVASVKELEDTLKRLDKTIAKQNKLIRSLIKLKDSRGLTSELVEILFDKILIYPNKRVEVIFTFSNELLGERIDI